MFLPICAPSLHMLQIKIPSIDVELQDDFLCKFSLKNMFVIKSYHLKTKNNNFSDQSRRERGWCANFGENHVIPILQLTSINIKF